MSKRSNATRSDGRIAVQVYIGRVDGKRRYKTVYGKTQKEADQKAQEIKIALGKGLDVTRENDTFGKWSDRLLQIKKSMVCDNQYNALKGAHDHLNRYLKCQPIKKVTADDIRIVLYDLAENNPNTHRPTSKRTLSGVLHFASQVFELAIDNRIIEFNPCRSVSIPKGAPQSFRRALTAEEQQWIADTPHRAQCAAMIMMYAGLRRGELIPLTWNDVDLKNGTITVNKAVESVNSKFRIKDSAKTPAGIRVVSIPDVLIDYLKAESQNKKSVFVCPSASNGMMSASSWKRLWESYINALNIKYGNFTDKQLETMGIKPGHKPGKCNPHKIPMAIPPITPHWLRHSFASLLYMSGVDVLTAKEQLGHADIKTTLEIYTHLDSMFKTKSMTKLNKYLSKRCKSGASQNIG